MNRANQLIIDTLRACGCSPVLQGDKIKVNAPIINKEKTTKK